MTISAFDLFSIGIGPSSSHTVGPMRAARRFVEELSDSGALARVDAVRAELFGSLAATGRGHGSDTAVLLGLEGADPETVPAADVPARAAAILAERRLLLLGRRPVAFEADRDLVLHLGRNLPRHPNAMTFTARAADGHRVLTRTYYSVGGGFVLDDVEAEAPREEPTGTAAAYPFDTAAELLDTCARTGTPISAVMLANETSARGEAEVLVGLGEIWRVMRECVTEGCRTGGVLPGGLRVRRRAPDLHRRLTARAGAGDQLNVMDWVTCFAMAVNEQNAAGGRVVTAPTNGAAGVIPAVLQYHQRFGPGARPEDVARFLLTAAAVGLLCKRNASISGAEVGCQGEVGSASAMAAAGLCEVLGGTPEQVANAAEIAMEHHLGMTCDPIGGLVQVPCIERNAMGAVKAITAARLALHGDGRHVVSLDQVIATMRATGADMRADYKETSAGGLAVNVVEC